MQDVHNSHRRVTVGQPSIGDTRLRREFWDGAEAEDELYPAPEPDDEDAYDRG